MSINTWKTELTLAARVAQSTVYQRWLSDLLRDEVARTERLASRFRTDSEVSRINRNPGRWTQVSWDLVTILTASMTAAAASEGLVDPLLGAQIVAAGYDTWADQDSGIRVQPTAYRWDSIEIAPGNPDAQVRIPPGTALDLGAVTKGWLADRLAHTVNTSTGADCIANMGGDLRIISPHSPWPVAAVSDLGEEIGMEAHDLGLATSGLGHRTWTGGHHLIDPRTGRPAEPVWASVSAMAGTAADANTAATAALILGESGPAWLASQGLDGWFAAADRQILVGQWSLLREPAPLASVG